jgi:hypothetical protein
VRVTESITNPARRTASRPGYRRISKLPFVKPNPIRCPAARSVRSNLPLKISLAIGYPPLTFCISRDNLPPTTLFCQPRTTNLHPILFATIFIPSRPPSILSSRYHGGKRKIPSGLDEFVHPSICLPPAQSKLIASCRIHPLPGLPPCAHGIASYCNCIIMYCLHHPTS